MTVITSTQFRANQGKYIDMAHKGEDVVLSSKKGYIRLTPVADNDKAVTEYQQNLSLMSFSAKAIKDAKEGKATVLTTPEDVDKWFDSL